MLRVINRKELLWSLGSYNSWTIPWVYFKGSALFMICTLMMVKFGDENDKFTMNLHNLSPQELLQIWYDMQYI